MGNDDGRIRVPARIHNWIIDQNLGSGYSGSIWKATNPYTGQVAAVKVQDVDHECPTNRFERTFYPSLQGGKGMPTLWASGVQGDYDYLVIDLLGPSLDNLYRQNGRRFDLWTTICMAMQIIERLELMHNRGLLHRDIQLGNCVTGLGENAHIIYMIDFGFSKRYIANGKHIPDSKAKRDFIGNYWFSSVNVHCRGKVPSRRDDMEALALMLIHVMTDGGLPWTRNGVPKTDKLHDILIRKKLRTTPDELCQGLPPVFEDFLRYCRRLKFLDQPNYGLWRDRFADLAIEMGFVQPNQIVSDDFAWPPRPTKAQEIRPSPKRSRSAGQAVEGKGVSIDEILGELAKLRLDKSHGSSELKKTSNGQSADKQQSKSRDREVLLGSPLELQKPSYGKAKAQADTNVIIISSGDESDQYSRQIDRTTKQAAIRLLTLQALTATSNHQLAILLHRLVGTLQVNRSKVITKEAFEFFGTFTKQLGNPSIFEAMNLRGDKDSTKTESSNDSHGRLRQRPPLAPKIETIRTLRTKLDSAPPSIGNAELSKMMDEFVAAVRSTSNKSLTKDGTAFLEGIAERLESP